MIKTMIARIELNNTLAPVQEYGRHQSRAAAKKQKKAPKLDPKAGDDKKRKNYNDRFYDLDDDFIDDDDIQEVDYGAALAGGGFNDDLYGNFDEADMGSNMINADSLSAGGFGD